jgi:hypothetical protein
MTSKLWHAKNSGEKITLFPTILHFIALYQDFLFAQPLYLSLSNEIKDLGGV